ncbi:ATP phosphoribosyltransferase [Paenibacillus radicis (ex Gao et al. 2016)]|uniref:ATP phosphoribosyltransferase n=1 Tax=Paenibacillus radicis (ex Gao et al. 2016) TaxID=1737354 RepID=A0A917M075_9BACL|nr:ATP phosphoribosyltransferase [Paenibacillus radicis (ex Gao et al. 2016)]GGG69357.1 ATP phosphoribosyltransferase [Paenibacillus radicis (ex Gao et al. 2016)]
MAIESVRLAIPKGNTEVSALFRSLGYSLPDDFDNSRNYIVPVAGRNIEFILAKAVDIPTYVEYGAADIGIVGKDVLLEENRDVYELMDLGISKGELSVWSMFAEARTIPRVATSCPKFVQRYYRERGIQVEIIKLNGGLELSLLTGVANCIIEVYNTETSNHLFKLEKICTTSLRLIANRASYQIKHSIIQRLYEEMIAVRS